MHWNKLLLLIVVVVVRRETCGVWVGGTGQGFMQRSSGQLHSGSFVADRLLWLMVVVVVVVVLLLLLLMLMLMVSHNWLTRDHWSNDSVVVLLHPVAVTGTPHRGTSAILLHTEISCSSSQFKAHTQLFCTLHVRGPYLYQSTDWRESTTKAEEQMLIVSHIIIGESVRERVGGTGH